MQVGSQKFTVDFKGCDRQYDWLEISPVSNKSNKQLTIYDSYNAECAARMIKRNVKLSKISDAYSATNTTKFDTLNDIQKHLLWKQYVAWHCNGYTAAPISDYINNPVFQESDKRVNIDLRDGLGYTEAIEKPSKNNSKLNVRIELKAALAKKMRL